MKIYSIYRATNKINLKVYLGFTSNFIKRKSAHKKNAERGCDVKFYRAIRKHGWENFIFDLVYQSVDKEHTRDIMEPYFISEYDSIKNGYNSTSGGEGAPTVEGETHPMKRQEQRIRQGNSVRGKNNPIHKVTEDKKKEMIACLFTPLAIEKKSGLNHYNVDKTLYKFENVLTGEIVILTKYEFAKLYNLTKATIGAIVRGNQRTTGPGGPWRFIQKVNLDTLSF